MINCLYVKDSVITNILKTLGNALPEAGGILGGKGKNVECFYYDASPCCCSATTYSPNTEVLNYVINNVWEKKEIRFMGFVHSHINNSDISEEDVEYMQTILNSNKLSKLILCIADYNYLEKRVSSLRWYVIELHRWYPVNVIKV